MRSRPADHPRRVLGRRSRLVVAGGLAALVVASLTGCGIEVNSTSAGGHATAANGAASSGASAQTAQEREQARRFAALPKPEAGVVNVAQGASLGITSKVISAYEATDPGVTVNSDTTSNATAFRELCNGQVDIAESTQPMTSAELDLCAENGVTFNTDSSGNPVPIELAADGIVVATKNEQDVGGDCVRLSTLHDVFEPSSTIDNWDQLNFDDLPLTTAGRSPSTDVFQLFAGLVLGTGGNATLADVRPSYRVAPSDDAVRALVVGSTAARRAANDQRAAVARALKQAAGRETAAVNAAIAAANGKVLAKIAAANKARAKSGVTLSAAQQQQIVTNNAQMDSNAKAAAGAAARAAFTNQIAAQVGRQYAPRRAAAVNPGVLGVFRYTYYELYEEQLRPLEVWDPATTVSQLEDEGVATTDSNIAERVTKTQRTQAGGGTATVESVSFPKTPTTPGAKYIAAGGHPVTVPATGPVDVNTTPNCVFPSRQTITSGVYPLSVRLLAYVPKNRLGRTEVANYLAYYLAQGQNTVADQQLIPLDNELRAQEYKQVTGRAISQSVLLDGESPPGPLYGTSTSTSTSTSTAVSGSAGSPSSASPTTASSNPPTTTTPSTGVPGVG